MRGKLRYLLRPALEGYSTVGESGLGVKWEGEMEMGLEPPFIQVPSLCSQAGSNIWLLQASPSLQ